MSLSHRKAPRSLRRTITSTVEREGVGLHSGLHARVLLSPAPAGQGIYLNGDPLSIARWPMSQWRSRIEGGSGHVETPEHLLAALSIAEIDDLLIEVQGGEVPILDGSAAEWLSALDPCPALPETHRDTLQLKRPLLLTEGAAWLIARPAERLTLSLSASFPGLGTVKIQAARGAGKAGVLSLAALANARTFGFQAWETLLRDQGLIRGVSLANTVVFDDDGHCLNPEGLRCVDEPFRHKALDFLGDLMILGRPIKASISMHRGGHRLHRRLVSALDALSRLDA
ncbi:MAG: UDP-3-O-acyl-N-acetylglucosamine deacetylase [Myxococcota bacterium]|nr:UDP-3-O-acyl-N-acetylglucosamine deacetylase [Myxococcota bacterium]